MIILRYYVQIFFSEVIYEKQSFSVCSMFRGINLSFVSQPAHRSRQKKAAEPLTIKLEGAKMAPVTFSHASHVDKSKVDCAVCHHKDADAKNPAACTSCHAVKEAKGGASVAKDAFHGKCQGCHKDAAGKGKAAPTKCTECHKK